MTEVHRYVPVSAEYLTAADVDGTYHAAWALRQWIDSGQPPKTVCGAEAVTLAAREAVNETGATLGTVVLTWPPYRDTRCPACWDQTGKPRPSHAWRNMKGPTDG